MSDWSAKNDTTVNASPASGGTQRVAQWVSGQYTSFVFDWTDQGAAGSTSYGISNYATDGNNSGVVVEIKGSAAAPAAGRIIRLRGHVRLVGGVRLGGTSPVPR